MSVLPQGPTAFTSTQGFLGPKCSTTHEYTERKSVYVYENKMTMHQMIRLGSQFFFVNCVNGILSSTQ